MQTQNDSKACMLWCPGFKEALVPGEGAAGWEMAYPEDLYPLIFS